MSLRDKKGSISIFVLVVLLFMAGFLIISVANNAGKSKTIKEQFNIISDIYAYTDGDKGAYDKAYTDLRKKNKQTMTATSEGTEDTETLELTKTFNEDMSNYRIYGNSVQDIVDSPNLLKFKDLDNVHNTVQIEPETQITDLKEGQLYYGNGSSFFTGFDSEYSWGENYITWIPTHDWRGPAYSCKVNGNTTYSFSMKNSEGNYISTGITINILEYDNQGNRITSYYLKRPNDSIFNPFTTQTNTAYVIVNFRGPTKNQTYCVYDIQLEEGSVATSYVPYGSKPSPEFPSEIESVGDKTRNLFPESLLLKSSKVTKVDNGYSVNAYPAIFGSGSLLVAHLKSVLKADTTYTMSARVSNYSSGQCGDIWIRNSSGNIFSLGPYAGVKSKSFTFTQEQIDSIYNVYIYGRSETPTIFNYIQIEEGETATEYGPYGKYRIPIRLVGKNLLNTNTVKNSNRYINSYNGTEVIPSSSTAGTWRVSDYINVIENMTYYINAINSNASTAGIAWYDANKTYISGKNMTTVNENNGNMTAPLGARYLRVSFRIDEGYNPNWKNTIQLEEFIEAKIYLDEPLRKVGVYEDYIDFKLNEVVRNVKLIRINGKEKWVDADNLLTNTYRSSVKLDNIVEGGAGIKILSNKFKSILSGTSRKDTENIQISNKSVYVRVLRNRLTDQNIDVFKEWVSSNTFEIVYPLAQEDRTEKLNLPELKTYEDYTKIEVLTDIAPSKIEVEYQGYTLD